MYLVQDQPPGLLNDFGAIGLISLIVFVGLILVEAVDFNLNSYFGTMLIVYGAARMIKYLFTRS